MTSRVRGCVLMLAGVVMLAGCGSHDPAPRSAAAAAKASPTASASQLRDVAMARPAALTKPTLSPDILIQGRDTLPASMVAAVRKLPGVTDVESFSMGSFYREERQVNYAAVDPATFRRFTPQSSARTQSVWDRVAGGEMAITADVGKAIQDKDAYVKMGNDRGAQQVHIGAYAPLLQDYTGAPVVDAVVNEKWAPKLQLPHDNALLLSTGATSPQKVLKALKPIIGDRASIRILAVNLPIDGFQTAVVTGGSISAALGTLRYKPHPDGSVTPDPAWVAANIRTESVPILGQVTCNKVMLPELRAALTEVVARGLAGKIDPRQYGGCFVPRYIAGTNQLSFHTFGTAIDLNVPGNQRGTVGQMDRTVVSIFNKWGFEWGGVWGYTDPMHFELHQIKKAK